MPAIVPSIQKRKESTGFFLHAKDDVPEVRKKAFEWIKNTDCHFEAVIGRKDYGIYEKKHNGNQSECYADLFSHMLVDNLDGHERLVLNIAHRSKCTTHKNLEKGLEKATVIARNKYPDVVIAARLVLIFSIQQQNRLSILWTIYYGRYKEK